MATYIVRDPQSPSTQPQTIEADTARDAARDFVSSIWNRNDGDEVYELEVTRTADSAVYDVTVEVECEPSFYTHSTRRKTVLFDAAKETP